MIAWFARKQKVIARSSAEFEYSSLASTATKVMWLQSLFIELGLPKLAAIPVIWCDNIGANSLAFNPVFHARKSTLK